MSRLAYNKIYLNSMNPSEYIGGFTLSLDGFTVKKLLNYTTGEKEWTQNTTINLQIATKDEDEIETLRQLLKNKFKVRVIIESAPWKNTRRKNKNTKEITR